MDIVNGLLIMLVSGGGQRMSDVFVSYKAEDRRRVKPLVEALQADGFSVWWDAQIGGGDEWRRSIERELDAAKCVLVVWSKRSTGPEGRFVRDEASRAMERDVYLPVRIDNVRLPLGFGETQALALTGWKGNPDDGRYRSARAAVEAIVTGKPNEGHHHHFETSVSRRGVIGGGAVAAVAIASAGGWFLFRPGAAQGSTSIAVLPFENLSGDPAQAYFSDGLAEELRSALARVGLQVVGRTSSEALKDADAETAATKLGVSNILTGSVRRSPTTIRVSAQLIKGSNGLERWSQDYDRKPGDALTIQSDIAQNVAQALSVALGNAARAALTVGGTQNAAAQDLYLRGRAELRANDSEASNRHATGLFDAAITLDPKFADAYARKSNAVNSAIGLFASGPDFVTGYGQAAALAKQAIALAPTLASGHFALARAYYFQLNMGASLDEYRRAHALPDADVIDLINYSVFLSRLGDAAAALSLAREALQRDPLNPDAYSQVGYVMMYARRYPEALPQFQRALAIAPNRGRIRAQLGWCLMQLGRNDEAAAQFRNTPGDSIYRMTGEAILFAREGNRSASDQVLAKAQQGYGDKASYQYGEIHAQRGERDQAFAALDRAFAVHDPGLTLLKVDPFLDPIRNDPRFAELEKKLNFPAAGSA
jgi:TolB-like protein/Tfp pilus assembly protein PilF